MYPGITYGSICALKNGSSDGTADRILGSESERITRTNRLGNGINLRDSLSKVTGSSEPGIKLSGQLGQTGSVMTASAGGSVGIISLQSPRNIVAIPMIELLTRSSPAQC